MSKVKILFVLILILLFGITTFIFLKDRSDLKFDQHQKAYIAWFNPTDDNLSNFYSASRTPEFLSTLNSTNTTFKNDMELFDFLRAEQSNSDPEIDAVLKDKRKVQVPIDFQEEEEIDLNMPEGNTYIVPGKLGYEVYNYDLLLFSPNKDTLSSKYLNLKQSRIEPSSRKSMSGKKDLAEAKSELTENFNKLIEDLKVPSNFLESGMALSDANIEKLKNPEILQNISINEITFAAKEFKEEDYNEGKLTIGSINIHLENCFRDFSQDVVFLTDSGELKVSDLNNLVKNLCRKQYEKVNGVLTGTCEDCTFYPADKTHALRGNYIPQTQSIDFAPGGESINKIAYADFKELYNAAKKDGIYIFVTSGYRSYNTQVATFNGWVNTELALGHSRSEAEVIANTYSAKPGFSEHQLGTALDLNGASCGISDGGCSSNTKVWNWLSGNAYKFGFVQSYPEGKINETGYTTEAWHYRWIGKDLALEYKNAGGGTSITLNKFLLNNGNF